MNINNSGPSPVNNIEQFTANSLVEIKDNPPAKNQINEQEGQVLDPESNTTTTTATLKNDDPPINGSQKDIDKKNSQHIPKKNVSSFAVEGYSDEENMWYLVLLY